MIFKITEKKWRSINEVTTTQTVAFQLNLK